MRVEQITWSEESGWQHPATIADAQMVLAFGHRSVFQESSFADDLASAWPAAIRVGCSTAGQIRGTEVIDDGAVATAVRFDHTEVRVVVAPVTAEDSASASRMS